jgi:ATP/maltotriose-dependent transcriptional regulator MalT
VGQPDLKSSERNPGLSAREGQILRLLEEGLSNQQIASRLNVTIHTVKNHVHSLFGKLGVASRAEAVAANRSIRHDAPGTGGVAR